MMEGGVLYLVATPIGNLADFSYRAVDVLNSVDLIACEDTRHSRVLFEHYGIRKPLTSVHDHSEKFRAPQIVAKVKEGAKVALVSDAGTPGIADPGFRLVAEAIREGVRVECVPGPAAFVTALVLSGFATDRFVFEGFLPVKDGQRRTRLSALKDEERTVIFYESPHRILKSVTAIKETLGDPEIAVARELTKKFEEVLRGKASDVEARLAAKKPLGEFVIVIQGPGLK